MYFSITVALVYNKVPCHEGIWRSGDIVVQRLDFTIGIGEHHAPVGFASGKKPLIPTKYEAECTP